MQTEYLPNEPEEPEYPVVRWNLTDNDWDISTRMAKHFCSDVLTLTTTQEISQEDREKAQLDIAINRTLPKLLDRWGKMLNVAEGYVAPVFIDTAITRRNIYMKQWALSADGWQAVEPGQTIRLSPGAIVHSDAVPPTD